MVNEIKSIDLEIIKIEKLAIILAENKTETTLELSVNDLTEKESEENKVKIDEDGGFCRGGYTSPTNHFMDALNYRIETIMGGERSDCRVEKKKNYNVKISEYAALNILGVLLGEAQQRRKKLVDSINKIGIEL